jgi:hypothetical protein
LALAGCAGARAQAPDPRQPQSSVTPLEYRSAFDGYRPFADQDLANWRQTNEEVGTAGGHVGHAAGQGPGKAAAKPQPGKPESTGGSAEHGGHHR